MGKRYLLVVALVALTSACESDEAKYTRLNQELLVAQLAVGNHAQAEADNKMVCPDLSHLSTNAYLSACAKRVDDDERRLGLAKREMNKFMAGR